jgi:hypothetical protein
MSALHSLSPLLRKGGGTVPSWTCRACSRSQGQAIPRQSVFASRIQAERRFATSVEGPASQAKAPAGNAASPNAGPNARSGPKSKRRRRLLIAGGAFTIGAAAVAVSDDAKHAYTATQRSYRVLETLVLNIREYARALSPLEDALSNHRCTVTATSSSATTIQSTRRNSKTATCDAPNEPSARSRRTARYS